MKDLRITNTLLAILVIPFVLYLLQVLSFIFVPLVFSMFITLMFLPLMRWFHKKSVPKPLAVFFIVLLFAIVLRAGVEVIQMAVREIAASEASLEMAEEKLMSAVLTVEAFFGIDRIEGENLFMHYIRRSGIMDDFGSALNFVADTLSVTLLTIFFTILMLSESINFQMVMNRLLFKSRYSSVKIFVKIERDIMRFVKVKIFVSILTGMAVSLMCVIFGVSFPIMWGVIAFASNFIQMIGSLLTVIFLSLFALVELDPSGTLLLFVVLIIGLQLLLGSVLEPILMGKTFRVNIVTVLFMLMLWGFLWGIPGMVMAVPITVFLKVILEQFPKTRVIASLMGGHDKPVKVRWRGKR